ncbi:hypothetical protein EPJ64_07080 [Brachyspira aalborgi]|jgi:hypothetical protein|uniref:Lipoprotein n=1 Tax=Brachyspira aalborgi TaxID=29522 RepID=A0AB38PZZ9_9SPIR|nr:hypothetical protein [Brachyspira aalborgi]MBS4764187.1 hypothetical protein [Brachyspira sp.]CCY76129.1 unknown [Brachyspira sp. CAG:700]TXJ14085.1 hypothetical protein EPJ77_11725 [Brachyspira aalborgi]TXJ18782.1 hypothetical protein EPJ64_07080 [Brachyspira aalborgi]TXJ25544.1 hypothetical protein EPJ73_05405 [Brachyspira aalborgi]
MSKIKKIILIIVSFFAFIIALCVIVDILDNNNLEVDESIISKKAELLRKNTFCFIDNGANINPLHKSYYINLNYIEDIVPIEYYYPEKYFYEGFWEGARFKNFYEYIFTIDFKNGKSINITNMNYGTNGYIGKLNFREMEFSRLEIVSEKMRNNKIEPIDYSFKIKSSIDKNYTELNFKDIIYFVSEIYYKRPEDVEVSYLYFYTVKSPYEYKFTFEYKYEAESIINKLKGYKQEELNPYGFVYYRRKPDDYTSMWDFTSEEDFKSKYNVDKYFN